MKVHHELPPELTQLVIELTNVLQTARILLPLTLPQLGATRGDDPLTSALQGGLARILRPQPPPEEKAG